MLQHHRRTISGLLAAAALGFAGGCQSFTGFFDPPTRHDEARLNAQLWQGEIDYEEYEKRKTEILARQARP